MKKIVKTSAYIEIICWKNTIIVDAYKWRLTEECFFFKPHRACNNREQYGHSNYHVKMF